MISLFKTEGTFSHLFPADEAIGAGGEAFGAPESTDEIIGIGEAALLTDFADGIPFIRQQLPGETDALAGDIFQRREAELFLKPFEKDVAAQVSLSAERIDRYFFREVFVDILQHVVQAAAVVVGGAIFRQQLEVLALKDTDQQFLEIEVGIDIPGSVGAAADTDQFIDQLGDVGIIVEMVLGKM